MKTPLALLVGAVVVGFFFARERHAPSPVVHVGAQPTPAIEPMAIILAPHAGDERMDVEIRRQQELVRTSHQPAVAIEALGWLFVAKARTSFDPGYYKLAEQCAFALEKQTAANESARSNSVYAAMLLRGHVLHNLHRFQEAEPLSRELVARRGLPMDFGLLGDVLMEQGQLAAAVDAYQKMMDLNPDSRAFARVAHIRWLKGDLAGAISAMQVAVDAVGSRDTESAAWMQTRLAFYQFQAGNIAFANSACDAALSLQTNYAPAQLLRGRILLAQGNNAGAVEQFRQALKSNPLPEYYWAAIEALASMGQMDEARQIEALLNARGATDDPRTYALFLATHETRPELALKLAREEIKQRADVFTYDSLAWAYFAAGNVGMAQENIGHALAEGTEDARILLHAAVIAQRAGDVTNAKRLLEKTYARRHLLWPSERKYLEKTMTVLAWQPDSRRASASFDQFSSVAH